MFNPIPILKRVFIFLPCLVFSSRMLTAQQLNLAVSNAYIITRLAEKFHVQPRPMDHDFSADVFAQLLKQLDPDKVFFTMGDVNELSKFQFEIADEIQHRQSTFLAAISTKFANRIYLIDTMIDRI